MAKIDMFLAEHGALLPATLSPVAVVTRALVTMSGGYVGARPTVGLRVQLVTGLDQEINAAPTYDIRIRCIVGNSHNAGL